MALDAARKAQIVEDYGQSKGDTGSPEVQVALLTRTLSNFSHTSKSTLRITIPVAALFVW